MGLESRVSIFLVLGLGLKLWEVNLMSVGFASYSVYGKLKHMSALFFVKKLFFAWI